MANTKAIKFGPVHARVTYTVKVRGEHGCSCLSSADLIDGQAECYLSSRPAGVVEVFYSEQCACCAGSGRVRGNRRVLQWKPCPACGGKGELHADELIRTIAA